MNNQVQQELIDKIRNIIADDKEITFLLIGRTGVGKSSTINSLFGDQVAKVGKYETTTMEVTAYSHEHRGIRYRIFDTPGLCDDLEETGNDEKYLSKICEVVQEVDVVWFVTELDATRLSGDEKRGIRTISERLGKTIWKYAVIVFTRADKLSSEAFLEALNTRTEIIRREIAKYAGEDGKSIPAVAVSNVSATLPNGKPWLGELFTTVFERMRGSAGIKFLLSMALDSGLYQEPKEESKEKIQRFDVSPQQKERIRQAGRSKLSGITSGAATGAAVGAAIAGPIGALLGGLAGGIFGWLF